MLSEINTINFRNTKNLKDNCVDFAKTYFSKDEFCFAQKYEILNLSTVPLTTVHRTFSFHFQFQNLQTIHKKFSKSQLNLKSLLDVLLNSMKTSQERFSAWHCKVQLVEMSRMSSISEIFYTNANLLL